ncbi:MAG: PAS domain S-box protein [Deltaproteobacteria bacterium]|nr:PAS domain S-box protein [Deltaproteobacteria bacterium]
MVKNDGTSFWAHLTAIAAQDADGAPVSLIVMSDISEHKRAEDALRESEERFRKLFKSHAAIKLVIDPETGIIIDANEAAAKFYGWPIEELKQMRIQQINTMPPEAVKAEMEKVVSTESVSFEFRHRRADDSIRDVEVFSNMIEVVGKKILYSIIHDITERKWAEASLQESEKALRVLLSEKEVLLKEVHHRVKNNLQVISSLISLQADSQADERLREALGNVRDRVQTMTLVHEMLHQTDDLERLDFADYAASLMQYLWRAHGSGADKVRLNLSFAPLMLPIEAAVHCGLILNELVSNIFKHAFSSGSGGEVTVALEHDPATGVACLRVSDNGVGLPAGLEWRQFSSLGLRLVQMLASQMRGTVELGPGPGTEFQFIFNV